jgi:hypothetical protein
LKSLVVDMLKLSLSLHVTGTITIIFTISQHCFRPKSHIPGPIICCGWGGKIFFNVIWWKATQGATQTSWTKYTKHSSVHFTLRSRYTRTNREHSMLPMCSVFQTYYLLLSQRLKSFLFA